MEKLKLSQNLTQPVLIIGEIDIVEIQTFFKVSREDTLLISEDYSIENMRRLIHFVNLRPMNSLKRLIIILKAEKLNIWAANTILKTLEEPPDYARIIITTLKEKDIIATIKSRCQIIRTNYVSGKDSLEGYLSPDKLAGMTVAEKFKWAGVMAEGPEAERIITLWQEYYREKMLKGEKVLAILKRLSAAKGLLQANISVKLLLENILLEFK